MRVRSSHFSVRSLQRLPSSLMVKSESLQEPPRPFTCLTISYCPFSSPSAGHTSLHLFLRVMGPPFFTQAGLLPHHSLYPSLLNFFLNTQDVLSCYVVGSFYCLLSVSSQSTSSLKTGIFVCSAHWNLLYLQQHLADSRCSININIGNLNVG